jgi:hypothetical protein
MANVSELRRVTVLPDADGQRMVAAGARDNLMGVQSHTRGGVLARRMESQLQGTSSSNVKTGIRI